MRQATQRGPLIGVVLLVVLAGLLRLRPLASLDLWWHLSMGRLVQRNRARVFEDPTSLGTGHPYTDPEWLFDLLVLSVWSGGGPLAVVLLTGGLAAASALLVFLLSRSLVGADRPWGALLLTALAVGGSSWRFDPRPQSVFLLLLAATMLFAVRARAAAGQTRWRWLAGLVALLVVWTQSHSSMVIGPVVVLSICLFRVPSDPRWSRGELLLLACCCLLPFLGPFGVGVVEQVLSHAGTDAAIHITDMRPMPASAWWPRPGSSVFWIEILLGLGVVGALRHRRVSLGSIFLVVLGLAMTLTAHRFRAAWALLAIPMAAETLSRGTGWTEKGRWRGVSAGVSLLVPLALWQGEPGPSLTWDRTSVPTDATEAMLALDVAGPLFNDYDGGGWLGWAGDGRWQVFIDGRTPTHFDDGRFFAARQGVEDLAVFARLDATHDFSGVLLRRSQGLCLGLDDHPDWAPAWVGAERVLFLPTDQPKLKPLTHLAVCGGQSSVVRCQEQGKGGAFLDEVAYLRTLGPAHGFADRLGLALALYCARDLQRASEHLEAARVAGPDHADLIRFSAILQLEAGQLEAGLHILEGARPEDGAALDLRLRVLRQLERPEEALPLIQARQRALGDATPVETWGLLAWALEASGDVQGSLHATIRAALLGHPQAHNRLQILAREGSLSSDQAILMFGAEGTTPVPSTGAPGSLESPTGADEHPQSGDRLTQED